MREQKRARTSISDVPSLYPIPQDLTTQILRRLPIKSLAQFKCVAKHWNSFISSNAFNKYHLQHQRSNKHIIFQTSAINKPFTRLNIENPKESNFVLSDLINGYETLGNNHIVGSCNGLICVRITREDSGRNMLFLIWNPSTQEKRLIVGPRCMKQHPKTCRFGFAYDSSSDDYKVLILCTTMSLGTVTSSFVYLYTLRNNVWRKLDADWFRLVPHDYLIDDYYYYHDLPVPVIVGERLHWLLENYTKSQTHLLAFDLAEESFSMIPLPPMDDLYREKRRNLFLCEIKECLCVCRMSWNVYDKENNKDWMEVWMLEKYGVWDSWKICNSFTSSHLFFELKSLNMVYPSLFELENNVEGSLFLMFYGFGYNNRNWLRIKCPANHPYSIEQVDGLSSVICAMSYVESFVSPNLGSRPQRSAALKSLISSFNQVKYEEEI